MPTFRAGIGFPLSDLPGGEGPALDNGPGSGFGIGVDCGAALTLGADAELHHTGRRRIAYFLVGGGATFPLGTAERAPWVQLLARIGPFISRDRGGDFLVADDPSGETILTADEGLAFGGGVRVGFPLDPRFSLIFDASIRAARLETLTRGPARLPGSFTEIRLPVFFGLRYQPRSVLRRYD